ncbi:MAG TPA: ABC transporter ATP-binding protein [Terriglobales bacterium]|nr:ABC transporter ATP-binding protein [Terriglobales bacterium]
MIELDQLSKTFDGNAGKPVRALQGIELRIASGAMVAIRGASGSGKSSLLNILGCLDRPTAGRYRFEGHDVAGATDRQLSRLRARRIGFIFQSFHLLDRITALEQVELPALYAGVRGAATRARARDLLSRVGLAARLRHYPSQLSGGEQQRVAVARALMNDPSLILADEPTGNLDAASGAEVMALLAELHHEGRTVILVTHDESVARRAERQVLLRDGKMENPAA